MTNQQALDVVRNFLNDFRACALERTPEREEALLRHLSLSLRNEVTNGLGVPMLLGVQNVHAAIELEEPVNIRGTGSYVVNATLEFDGDARKTFRLTQEEGEWRITAIEARRD